MRWIVSAILTVLLVVIMIWGPSASAAEGTFTSLSACSGGYASADGIYRYTNSTTTNPIVCTFTVTAGTTATITLRFKDAAYAYVEMDGASNTLDTSTATYYATTTTHSQFGGELSEGSHTLRIWKGSVNAYHHSYAIDETAVPEPSPSPTPTETASPTPTETATPTETVSPSPSGSESPSPSPDPSTVKLDDEQFSLLGGGMVLLMFLLAAVLGAQLRRP